MTAIHCIAHQFALVGKDSAKDVVKIQLRMYHISENMNLL